MEQAFSRSALLLGDAAIERLSACRVAVFGVGGVGGYAVEALARAGVGALDLIDSDTIAVSNLNRQLLALHSTIGQPKVEVAAARVRDINPVCRVQAHRMFFLPETKDTFDFSAFDYVIDAIDTVAGKLALIEAAKAAGTPIICALGAGNKLDPTAFRVSDLAKTSVDPLARALRSACRKRGIEGVKVVYSTEPPVKANAEAEGCPRKAIPGSVPFVPPVMGMILAGEVIKELTKEVRL